MKKRYFIPNVLNSVQLGEAPRALHFTHSNSKELKDFRLQDDSLVPAKVWVKLSPSLWRQNFRLELSVPIPAPHAAAYLHLHTCTRAHTHTHGCTDIVQSHTTGWNITGQRENLTLLPRISKEANFLKSSRTRISAFWHCYFWFAFQPSLLSRLAFKMESWDSNSIAA